MDLFYHPKVDFLHLFISGAFRKASITILSLFSPIYIFLGAKSLVNDVTFALILTLSYYFVLYISKFLTLLVSENLSQRIGFKGTMWLSALPFIGFVLSLMYSYNFPYLYLVSSVLWGIHAAFYWWGYNGYFVKSAEDSHNKHVGEAIGQAQLLETIAAIVTPFLGAMAIFLFGFSAIFVFSALLFLISLIFLNKDHDKRQKHDIGLKDVFNLFKTHKLSLLAYLGTGGEAVLHSIAWPLFLYFFFKQVVNLGVIVSLATLIAALFGIIIGRFIDRYGERKVIGLGVPILFVSNIFKFVFRTFTAFVIADSFRNFGERMVELPLNELTFKKAIQGFSAQAIMFREIALLFGAVFSIAALVVILYFGGDLSINFLLGAVLGVFPGVAVIKHKLRDNDR